MPYFKTEPGLPQTHLEGNRLVLTCLAEGSWPLEFKWLRNDSEVAAYSSEYRYLSPQARIPLHVGVCRAFAGLTWWEWLSNAPRRKG